MARELFELTYVLETITEESATEGDVASRDVDGPTAVDVREAIDALESQCWDSVDDRGDGTVICYPADSHQDLRTGEWESTQVILTGDPWKVGRLMRHWRSMLQEQSGRLPY